MKRDLPETFGIQGHLTVKALQGGQLLRELGPFKNKVVTSSGYGRNLILRALARDTTYAVGVDTAALGDDNTAAADGDTDLGNSLVSDLPVTNASVTNNVLTIDVFVPDGDLPNDTYEEFGLFADGRMMSRVIISPAYTKGSGEDTLFTYTLTMTG